jgi:hypothetical protein
MDSQLLQNRLFTWRVCKVAADRDKGRKLEQNQSKRTLVKGQEGGFFLRKKPLEDMASGYSYSGFAIVKFTLARSKRIVW